jgi:hypothetical protein
MRAFEQDVESLLGIQDESEQDDEPQESESSDEDDAEVQALQCSLACALIEDESANDEPALDRK